MVAPDSSARKRRNLQSRPKHMSRPSVTAPAAPVGYARTAMRGGTYVLNFYSAVFVDQLKRGRKTATIRLGDKSSKYERGQVVWVTVGFRHSPRQKIFSAVIDDVEVKKVSELSRRDIEHDNPEFRRRRGGGQLPRADLQPAGRRGRPDHGDPLLADRRAARVPLRQRRDAQPQLGVARLTRFLTTWLLDSPAGAGLGRDLRPGALAELVARGRGGGGDQRPASEDGVGTVSKMVWKSLLPYRVDFEVTTTRVERPHLLRGRRGRRAERSRPLAAL